MSRGSESNQSAFFSSRRAFLQWLATAGAALPLLPASFESLKAAHAAETKSDKINIMNPAFSVAEREHRWTAVRRIMAKPQWNLDAILAPASGDTAYPRYLTQIGGRGGSADVIFPRDDSKPVHALVSTARNRIFWENRLNAWRSDGKLVIGQGEGSKSIAGQFKNLGLNKAGTRIGVVKLSGSRFDPEGLVSATFLENLKTALPGVQFLSIEKWGADAGPIDEPAMIKSAEEHEVIRHAVATGENAIETIRRAARPPARHQGDIWLRTFAAMFAATGEDPILKERRRGGPAGAAPWRFLVADLGGFVCRDRRGPHSSFNRSRRRSQRDFGRAHRRSPERGSNHQRRNRRHGSRLPGSS